MFDLCIYWLDYKIVCVVYECDLDKTSNEWSTNMNSSWHLTDKGE